MHAIMAFIYDAVCGDIRYRTRQKVNYFEKKARGQERWIDMDINENRKRKKEAELKLKMAQNEKKHLDMMLYARIVARAMMRERKLEQQKFNLRSQVEQLRDRAASAISAKNVIDLEKLLSYMDSELCDVKRLTKAVRNIEHSETKAQVVDDLVNETLNNEKNEDDEEEEIMKVLMSQSTDKIKQQSTSINMHDPDPLSKEDEERNRKLNSL